jgi:hypothetical protein
MDGKCLHIEEILKTFELKIKAEARPIGIDE